MFIIIMILILGTCISVLTSIYYNTTSLLRDYGSVNAYYGAYYGAMASIERGLLMSKLKYPSYDGIGGFYGDEVIGAKSNLFNGDFWKLNQGDNSMIWDIRSSTKKIVGVLDTHMLHNISFYLYNDNINSLDLIDHKNLYDTGWTKNNQTNSITTRDSTHMNNMTGTVSIGSGRNENKIAGGDFNRILDFGATCKTRENGKCIEWSGYTIRGLTESIKDNKEYGLSGNFDFNGNSKNPRAALYGKFDNSYN